MFLETSFITIESIKHVEYYPLINPRFHLIGQKKTNI